jgi:hypothetical protein
VQLDGEHREAVVRQFQDLENTEKDYNEPADDYYFEVRKF